MKVKFKLEFTLMFFSERLPFHLSPLTFRDLDKIDDLMQDITEQQDVAQEINDAISRPFGETFDEVDNSKSIFMALMLTLSLPFYVM